MNDTQILDILQADMNMQFCLMCMDRAYATGGMAAVNAKLAEWGTDSSDAIMRDSCAVLRRAWNLTHAAKLEAVA